MKRSFMWGVVTTLLATNVMQYWFVANANERGDSTVDYEQQIASSSHRESLVVRAVQNVSPTVVAITTEVETQSPFSWMGSGRSSSEGSGVVIDSDGVVLTNAHVVEGAVKIEATFSDDSVYSAEIIGLAPELDLAGWKLTEVMI